MAKCVIYISYILFFIKLDHLHSFYFQIFILSGHIVSDKMMDLQSLCNHLTIYSPNRNIDLPHLLLCGKIGLSDVL